MLAAEYFVALQTSWLALAVLRAREGIAGAPGRVGVLFPLVLVLVLVMVLVLTRFGQGGSRMSTGNRVASSVPVGDRTQDTYWKLGIFYFNRDDPSTLIEKRFGLGYTLNFARPTTWVIMSLVLVGALVPVLVARLSR
jgi:uncharacterized membrane protein